jgi:predicted HicB family RNase H-like nuclease
MSDKIDIRFPAKELPLKQRIEEAARARGISVGQLVREALREKYEQTATPAAAATSQFFTPQ